MLAQKREEQVPNFQTRNSKIISNTVLKMPTSFSPFQSPLKYRQIAITNDCEKIEESQREDQNDITPLILAHNQRKEKKISKANVFRSRRKTMLRIITTVKGGQPGGNKNRKYVVLCRYGNEAHTFTQVVDQAHLLQNDPELLIDFLTSAKKPCKDSNAQLM